MIRYLITFFLDVSVFFVKFCLRNCYNCRTLIKLRFVTVKNGIIASIDRVLRVVVCGKLFDQAPAQQNLNVVGANK